MLSEESLKGKKGKEDWTIVCGRSQSWRSAGWL